MAAIVVLGLMLSATEASTQGIFEYWKAGTKRGPSRSASPHGHAHPGPTGSPAPSPPAPAITGWTVAWFSDSTLVRRRVGETIEALRVPMIGQTFPLPRGGGFACTRLESGAAPAAGDLVCVIECAGPELGGRRQNWFYADGADGTPTLDRVRWLITAPPSSPRAPWRAFVRAVADSLSRAMGPPAWSGPDSMDVAWNGPDYATTIRLHATPTPVDSLEIECVSKRLAAAHLAGR
jgi:hypothetical protein